MNQSKIGIFISNLRKEKGLTQASLAEMLGITDRAVSKWERGLSMPDSSIMLPLCEILGISVNELLTGERIDMENYNKKAEENLLKMKKQNEKTTKFLLNAEIVIAFISSIQLFAFILLSALAPMSTILRIFAVVIGIIIFTVGITACTLIEQKAGYYECEKCRRKFVPTFAQVFFAMHYNRTRYMKCPHCGKKAWCKKRISDE